MDSKKKHTPPPHKKSQPTELETLFSAGFGAGKKEKSKNA